MMNLKEKECAENLTNDDVQAHGRVSYKTQEKSTAENEDEVTISCCCEGTCDWVAEICEVADVSKRMPHQQILWLWARSMLRAVVIGLHVAFGLQVYHEGRVGIASCSAGFTLNQIVTLLLDWDLVDQATGLDEAAQVILLLNYFRTGGDVAPTALCAILGSTALVLGHILSYCGTALNGYGCYSVTRRLFDDELVFMFLVLRFPLLFFLGYIGVVWAESSLAFPVTAGVFFLLWECCIFLRFRGSYDGRGVNNDDASGSCDFLPHCIRFCQPLCICLPIGALMIVAYSMGIVEEVLYLIVGVLLALGGCAGCFFSCTSSVE